MPVNAAANISENTERKGVSLATSPAAHHHHRLLPWHATRRSELWWRIKSGHQLRVCGNRLEHSRFRLSPQRKRPNWSKMYVKLWWGKIIGFSCSPMAMLIVAEVVFLVFIYLVSVTNASVSSHHCIIVLTHFSRTVFYRVLWTCFTTLCSSLLLNAALFNVVFFFLLRLV